MIALNCPFACPLVDIIVDILLHIKIQQSETNSSTTTGMLLLAMFSKLLLKLNFSINKICNFFIEGVAVMVLMLIDTHGVCVGGGGVQCVCVYVYVELYLSLK